MTTTAGPLVQFREDGVTDTFSLELGSVLDALQSLICDLTSHLMSSDFQSSAVADKVAAEFEVAPSPSDWSKLVKTVNESSELEDIIQSPAVVDAFRSVYKGEPERFPICIFRASMAQVSRSRYALHQDIGTWYLSGQRQLSEPVPATLWVSVNGTKPDNSLRVFPRSFRRKLYRHRNVAGQGYFDAAIGNLEALGPGHVVTAAAGEAVLFHGLTVHGSVSGNGLRPRYSIDIRYSDPNSSETYKVDPVFRLQRMLGMGSRAR